MATFKLYRTDRDEIFRITYQPGAMHVGKRLEHLYFHKQNEDLAGHIVDIDPDSGRAFVELDDPYIPPVID